MDAQEREGTSAFVEDSAGSTIPVRVSLHSMARELAVAVDVHAHDGGLLQRVDLALVG